MAEEATEQAAMLAGQVAEVRRIAEVGFTDVRGQLALILQQVVHGERQHAALADTVADNYRLLSERLDEHARSIQAAAEERAGERARIQTMADNARRFATWVPIVVSILFGVAGIALKTWA
ncbi:hypothetical protein [Streptosporangium sandarakinum]|uniref:Uncharacterized protein n=1 Tax=Streptosporangium sandarakinum TaxID=1260955 RepID=A0A852V4C8_9ACTN|nr:hypothetical protein [Streptosporangium sandarakinum]NYF44582.1 hypothetical protein [Streptosporangium sandarakinum]